MEPKRFTSPIKYLDWISEIINVVCPSCSKNAVIKEKRIRENGIYYWRSNKEYSYECKNCYTVIEHSKIHKYELKLNCPNCGKNIMFKHQWTKKEMTEISISCKLCSETIKAKPKTVEINAFWYKNNMVEFKYWYQLRFKDNLLWAVNKEHIEFLEDYVSADLRERYPKRYGMMLAERLPKFIKNKKNRESLLKALKKLKEK